MSILDEADNIVNGDRAVAYGPAERNLTRIAAMWTTYLGHAVTARDVTMCMILLKVGRDAHKAKRDNLVDIAGYAELAGQLEVEPAKPGWTATDAIGLSWWCDDDGKWWCSHMSGDPSAPTIGNPGITFEQLQFIHGPLVEETR